MHEILDKLGAYGIPLSSFPGRFVGTIMVFASSHGQDLAVKRAMEMGRIPLKRV